MKGKNTLKLNHATMVEAVNLWLGAQFKTPPTCEKVTQLPDHFSGEFEVRVSSPDEVQQ